MHSPGGDSCAETTCCGFPNDAPRRQRDPESRALRVAVLNCEDAVKWSDHLDLLEGAYGRPGDEWVAFACCSDNLPTLAEINRFDAVLCPGSRHSATDDSQVWLQSLLTLLSQIAKQRHPQMLGICFGHQAIARALGGVVGANSDGNFRFAPETISCLPAWKDLPYVSESGCEIQDGEAAQGEGETKKDAVCPPFVLLESHGECVQKLPAGASLVATSDYTTTEIFAVSDCVLSFQAHPEFTPALMNERIYPAICANGKLAGGREEQEEARTRVERADPILTNTRIRTIIRRFLQRQWDCTR
jgi:GMP synthase-like glutamine amidotransferase